MPRDRDGAAAAGALFLLLGSFFFGLGLLILHDLLR
jgi:hypothetical protein